MQFQKNLFHKSHDFLRIQMDGHDDASSCYSRYEKPLKLYLKIWRFLEIVICVVLWTERNIPKTGSLSYFRRKYEEKYWNAVNQVNLTWLLTWGSKVSNFRNRVVGLEYHMAERVQNSVTWSVIHHCQNYLGIAFRYVLWSDGRRRLTISCSDPMLKAVQIRILLKFGSYFYFCLVVCKPDSRFSVEPNPIFGKKS